MKRTLYSAHYGASCDPFKLTQAKDIANKPDDLVGDGILLLQGGEDIAPCIYNAPNNSYCHAGPKPSQRDTKEMALVSRAVKMGMPIIGICRGAQMLCALDGGYLVQHIEGHTGSGTHELFDTRTGEIRHTNSCHHQMMVPNKYNTILATDNSRTIRGYSDSDKEFTVQSVPEIVYFPQLNALGIQGHPEWIPNSAFADYCSALIKEFLLKD